MQGEQSFCSRARRRIGRWVWPQILAAGVLLLGQLLGAVHLAIVPHVICLEHGELAHAAESGLTSWLALIGDLSRNAVESEATAAEWGDEHQHCIVQGLLRNSLSRSRPLMLVLTTPSSEDPCLAADRAERSDLALFRLAPKHSPPA